LSCRVIGFLLLTLVVRALIPAGFMPSASGSFPVEICPEGFPSQLLHGVAHEHGVTHEHGTAHDHSAHAGAGATHHHGSSGFDHCIFTGLAGAGPAPCATPGLLPLTALATQPCEIACPAFHVQRVRIPQPRAPPALPA
jgi:hypothetical protein